MNVCLSIIFEYRMKSAGAGAPGRKLLNFHIIIEIGTFQSINIDHLSYCSQKSFPVIEQVTDVVWRASN